MGGGGGGGGNRIYDVIYMFTVSRDGKFSNLLRNDPKMEPKKGSLL